MLSQCVSHAACHLLSYITNPIRYFLLIQVHLFINPYFSSRLTINRRCHTARWIIIVIIFFSKFSLFIVLLGSGFDCMPIMKNKYLLIDLTPSPRTNSFSYTNSAYTSTASLNYSAYFGSIDLDDIQITRF